MRWLACLVVLISGCASGGQPRARLGCLPFPGIFTLFNLADPYDLGAHHYEWFQPFDGQKAETERGIVYTCRAGFLDVAHLRDTIDWAWFMTRRVEQALREGRTALSIEGRHWTTYHVTFEYPPFWEELSETRREAVVTELAGRIGRQLAYVVVTWHEIITWFGYKSLVVVSEQGSSFTYEDVMSHVVGLTIADRAIRDDTRSFDDAVTHALNEELDRLGVVSPQEALEAIMKVEGRWWVSGRCLQRRLDVDLHSGTVVPWLVADLEFCESPDPELFHLPSLTDVAGHDCRGIYDVEIETAIIELSKLQAVFSPNPRPQRFRPETDFPVLIDHIERKTSE